MLESASVPRYNPSFLTHTQEIFPCNPPTLPASHPMNIIRSEFGSFLLLPCSNSVCKAHHTATVPETEVIEQPEPQIPPRPVMPPEAAAFPKLQKIKVTLDK